MNRKPISYFLISLFAAVFALTGGPVWAQTGDDIVPAIEEVCDGDPFSFGLCNAYCEALDCDSETPIGSERACGRVLDNYHRHSDGQDPPCETPAVCPCAFDVNADLASLSQDFDNGGPWDQDLPLDFATLQEMCATIFDEQTYVGEVYQFQPGTETPQGVRLLYWVETGDPASCNALGGAIDGNAVGDPEDLFNFDYPPPYLMESEDLNSDEEEACRADLAALCVSIMN